MDFIDLDMFPKGLGRIIRDCSWISYRLGKDFHLIFGNNIIFVHGVNFCK